MRGRARRRSPRRRSATGLLLQLDRAEKRRSEQRILAANSQRRDEELRFGGLLERDFLCGQPRSLDRDTLWARVGYRKTFPWLTLDEEPIDPIAARVVVSQGDLYRDR